jgi:hypothetical protein
MRDLIALVINGTIGNILFPDRTADADSILILTAAQPQKPGQDNRKSRTFPQIDRHSPIKSKSYRSRF